MKITRIEGWTVWVDLVKPYLTAEYKDGGMRRKPCVVLRVTTDTGLVGWGETDPYPTFTYESPAAVMVIIRDHLGPAVLGMDSTNLVALHATMDEAVRGWLFAKAAIDIAAHDITGRAWGVPVYELLGGRVRDRVPLIWPIGGDSPEANAAEARDKVDEGYRSLHIKLGALSPDEDVARLQAIRQTVGPDIPLMVDANQGWDRATALKTIRRIEPFGLSMVEQPIPAWDLEGMAQIQAATETPLSADEGLRTANDALNLVRDDAARVFSLKVGKSGGLFRTRQIAAVAEAAGVPCFVNTMIKMGISVAASLHLSAGLPNLVNHGHALMSNLRIQRDILVENSFQYEGRDILIPDDCRGLGVDVDEAELEARTVDRFVLEA